MKITLGTTYFNCPKELKLFISRHIDYVDELIVVDDGSEKYPAVDYMDQQPKLKLYRVKKDYGFNSHGCRNLIMKEAENDWVILLDVDRRILTPKESIESIKKRNLKQSILYRFVAMDESNNSLRYNTIHESVNDFLIHKNHFFSAGGYDEELITHRTGDRQYFIQLQHYGSEYLLNDVEISLVRPPTGRLLVNKKHILASSKDSPKVPKNILELIDNRMLKPDPKKNILTFEWERVF